MYFVNLQFFLCFGLDKDRISLQNSYYFRCQVHLVNKQNNLKKIKYISEKEVYVKSI